MRVLVRLGLLCGCLPGLSASLSVPAQCIYQMSRAGSCPFEENYFAAGHLGASSISAVHSLPQLKDSLSTRRSLLSSHIWQHQISASGS